MKKIRSLFQRDFEHGKKFGDLPVIDAIANGADWVAAGQGTATRKFDGTCCMVRGGQLFKRYDAKQGKQPPANFEPAQDYDPITGHMPGWLPVGDGPEDKHHRQAWENQKDYIGDGTYELCGPKVQANPEAAFVTAEVGEGMHLLIRHGVHLIGDCPRDFAGLRNYLEVNDIEGIVWHHDDGRMVKIKAKDFGIKRGRIAEASTKA